MGKEAAGREGGGLKGCAALAAGISVADEKTSFEYRLQRLPLGVVVLDAERRVLSASPFARRLLGQGDKEPFGVDVLSLHPDHAREKVGWLIAAARTAADGMASLIVATPMGNFLAKVTALRTGPAPEDVGSCMMFFLLGAMDEAAEPPRIGDDKGQDSGRYLLKLPIQRGGGVIALIDVDQIVSLSAQGHYSEARSLEFSAFCPRSLASMERRLDPDLFLRVHRRHLVAIRHVLAAERQDGRWLLRMNDKAASRIPVSREKVELMRRLLAV
jgi:hypothetical protein